MTVECEYLGMPLAVPDNVLDFLAGDIFWGVQFVDFLPDFALLFGWKRGRGATLAFCGG